jgi:DNA-binding transcriptional LysR family regulator
MLEEELNSRLFHRSNSGYELTEVGERLLAGAEAIESALPRQRLLRTVKDRRSAGRFASAHPMGSAASSWRHACGGSPTGTPSWKSKFWPPQGNSAC